MLQYNVDGTGTWTQMDGQMRESRRAHAVVEANLGAVCLGIGNMSSYSHHCHHPHHIMDIQSTIITAIHCFNKLYNHLLMENKRWEHDCKYNRQSTKAMLLKGSC